MSEKYDEYIRDHVANVRKGYLWLKANVPHVLNDISESDLEHAINNHDFSKNSEEEYDAYDAYFYGENKSAEVMKNFHRAWLHHIQNNPHHWQHWVLINDEPTEGFVPLEMPKVYIVEMICDWWSFSWKAGNLYEIFDWYKQRKDYIDLHENTRAFVEDILNEIYFWLEGTRYETT